VIDIAGRAVKYRMLTIFRPVRGPAQYWKDLKMFALTKKRGEVNAAEKGTKTTMGDVRGKKVQPGTIHGLMKRIGSPSSEMRKEKVRGIRRQLAEGKYDIDKRLNIAFDKLFEDLIT
jgi:anti-sigma28 factor (negative regulator of flagellin synthesis)